MDTIDIKCGLTNARRINKRAQEESNTWARKENEEEEEEKRKEEHKEQSIHTHRDEEEEEKEREKWHNKHHFGCFGSQLLLPLATATTTPSAPCTYGPPFAIHKIRASCINLCTGVDIRRAYGMCR